MIAASGMCNGGRVVAYLKALLPDKRTDVIFAGYQAQGTLGRIIQQQPEVVDIDGDRVEVNARIHTMSGYSAHADQHDLLRFVQGIEAQPKEDPSDPRGAGSAASVVEIHRYGIK